MLPIDPKKRWLDEEAEGVAAQELPSEGSAVTRLKLAVIEALKQTQWEPAPVHSFGAAVRHKAAPFEGVSPRDPRKSEMLVELPGADLFIADDYVSMKARGVLAFDGQLWRLQYLELEVMSEIFAFDFPHENSRQHEVRPHRCLRRPVAVRDDSTVDAVSA